MRERLEVHGLATPEGIWVRIRGPLSGGWCGPWRFYACQTPAVGHLSWLLVEANDAFDEVTGDYAKELVKDEEWRQYATPDFTSSGCPVPASGRCPE